MSYTPSNLTQLITEISEYETQSYDIKNGCISMDFITKVMQRMSYIIQLAPEQKQEISRLDFIHHSTPMVRHIVKDAKDPATLAKIAESILTRSPSEFKMLVINNNAYLEKHIRRIFKEKIDACIARWDTEVRGFFRASGRAQEAVRKRDIETGKLHDEMQEYLSGLTKLNKCLYELDFSFLKHISDFKQHLLEVANRDLEANPWLKIVDRDILNAIHHGFTFCRRVKPEVWEEPVVISTLRTHLHHCKDRTEFLRMFIVYPTLYHERYKILVDTFTGESPSLTFDDIAEETAPFPEFDDCSADGKARGPRGDGGTRKEPYKTIEEHLTQQQLLLSEFGRQECPLCGSDSVYPAGTPDVSVCSLCHTPRDRCIM